jgi:hypothetical protein
MYFPDSVIKRVAGPPLPDVYIHLQKDLLINTEPKYVFGNAGERLALPVRRAN